MAETATTSTPSLSEQYLLKGKEEKTDVASNPKEVKDVKPATAISEEKTAEAPTDAAEEKTEDASAATAAEEKTEDTSGAAAKETTETPPTESSSEDAPAVDSENTETTEDQKSYEQEAAEPEIKLETAPADFRFPTTNQTRHCFTRYIEYHRCLAAKEEGAQECDKFAKYYRALCPSEWVERWNEQRENGTFPGPL